MNISLIVSPRKWLGDLLKYLGEMPPQPFYTIEDVRTVGSGVARTTSPASPVTEGTIKKK